MNRDRTYMYSAFERFWHWTQAALIFLLVVTGFEIHGSVQIVGYRQAVAYHNAAASTFLVVIAFAVFWHFTTGEWRQYVPTRQMLRAQVEYYVTGIFRDAPHPIRKTRESKLNPLQRIVYLALKILVIPLMVASGLLYLLNRYPSRPALLSAAGLKTIAIVHTAGAFFLIAFVVGHVYLTTTGHTPLSNLRAMLTGDEELHGNVVSPAENADIVRGQA